MKLLRPNVVFLLIIENQNLFCGHKIFEKSKYEVFLNAGH